MAMVGSRGDIQPFVALAHELVSAGHEVAIASNADAAGLVAASGARFEPIDMDVHEMLSSPQGQRLLSTGDTRKFLDFANQALATAGDSAGQGVLKAAENADAFVAGLGIDDYALAAADALGLPLLAGYLAPWLPTGEYPQIMMSRIPPLSRSLGRPANVASHRLLGWVYWRGRRDHINAFRRSLGLADAKLSIVTAASRLGTPVLLAYSTALHPAARDWHPGTTATGYWRLSPRARQRLGQAQPPPGLADWLDAGEPPVFIGFGSMPILDPAPVVEAAAEAARRTKARILIGAGWTELARAASALPGAALPEYVHMVGDVDHDWLFPRCRAVIHHGGTGTTGAGLTAGRPTWIYSLFYDQPFWGNRVRRLGAGGHSRFRHIRADALASAIRELDREDIRRRAAALGDQLRREDGVAAAINVITRVADGAR
jgi:sterol 3beta-glucosyltransferase